MDQALCGRIMLNGDCGSYFYNPELWQPEGGPYHKVSIHRMVHSLAAAGIDTFLINPNMQLPCYPSKRLRYMYQDYKRGDREYGRLYWQECEGWTGDALEEILDRQAFVRDKHLDLIEEGTDWLEETSLACRKEGISPWLSVRMNDSHGGVRPQSAYMNNDLLLSRPDLWLDKPCIDPAKHFERYGLNYGKEECRDYMLSLIDDLLTYDFEGMELDFGRDPVIAAPMADEEVRDAICQWLHEIRRRTEKKAAEMGKPFYLGLKGSCNLGILYDFGLDVERCVEEGIFDFVALSNGQQTCWEAPIDDQKRRFGDKVAVYGYIEETVNWYGVRSGSRPESRWQTRGRKMTYSAEMLLGNAAGKLALGADGIIFYNNFFSFDKDSVAPPVHWAIRHVGDIGGLRGMRKGYSLNTAFFYPLGTVALERPAALPELICPTASRTWRLPMLAEPGEGLVLKVQVTVERRDGDTPRLAVSLNQHWPVADCAETGSLLFASGDFDLLQENHIGFDFTLPRSWIRDGWNEVTVFNLESESGDLKENARRSVWLMNLDLAVIEDEKAGKTV